MNFDYKSNFLDLCPRNFSYVIILGLLLGSLFLATDLVTGLARLQQEEFNVTTIDIAFPASIFVRSQVARERVFWMLEILTSLIEPLTNNAAAQVLTPIALAFVLVQSFGTNLLQAAFFRKYGFIAAILVRVAFYIHSM